jgi:hypothetical protein
MAALARQNGLQFDHQQQPSLGEICGRQERPWPDSSAGVSQIATARHRSWADRLHSARTLRHT